MKVKKHTERDEAMIKASIKERLIFQNFQSFIKEIEITNISRVESYEHWDVTFTSGSTTYICEIKCRNYKKNEYADAGWIIEENKKKELQKIISTDRAKLNDVRALYLNFFNDGVVMWDVSTLGVENIDTNEYARSTAGKKTSTIKKENQKLKNKDSISMYDWKINYVNYEAKANTIYDFMFPSSNNKLVKII